MSYLTMAWSMAAALSTMLGLFHLSIWLRQRSAKIYLLSCIMAFAAAAEALTELGGLHAEVAGAYVWCTKLQNVAVGVLLVAMVWFIDLRLNSARRWLTLLISMIWVFCEIVNWLSPNSLVFAELPELQRVQTFWGDIYTIASGPPHAMKWLADLTILLIAVHALDATIRCRRQGGQQRAVWVGGSVVLFILVAGIHTVLVDAGVIASPYMISFAFFAIIFVLSYDLIEEVVKVPVYSRRLEDARREMDRVARANVLGEFASSLAHELNQPLTAILSNAQAARRFLDREPFDKPEIESALEDIAQDGKRAGDIIHWMRRMLAKRSPERETFSLKEAVDEVIRLLRGELDDHNIRLWIVHEREVPLVDAGLVETQQVLVNLLSNAIRAVDREGGRGREIRLKTKRTGDVVRLSVEDSGPGVNADEIEDIFEPFYSTKGGGLGMGLALCRRIVQAYGGEIGAENRSEGGACFWFTLPAAATVS